MSPALGGLAGDASIGIAVGVAVVVLARSPRSRAALRRLAVSPLVTILIGAAPLETRESIWRIMQRASGNELRHGTRWRPAIEI